MRLPAPYVHDATIYVFRGCVFCETIRVDIQAPVFPVFCSPYVRYPRTQQAYFVNYHPFTTSSLPYIDLDRPIPLTISATLLC